LRFFGRLAVFSFMVLTSAIVAIVAIVLAHIPRIIPIHSLSIFSPPFHALSIARILVPVNMFFENFQNIFYFLPRGLAKGSFLLP
jgi:hypothetical protein